MNKAGQVTNGTDLLLDIDSSYDPALCHSYIYRALLSRVHKCTHSPTQQGEFEMVNGVQRYERVATVLTNRQLGVESVTIGQRHGTTRGGLQEGTLPIQSSIT